jgi:hypothetical protein
VRGNTAVENANRGIHAGNYSLVHDNVAEGNLGAGIVGLSFANVFNNIVSNNGSTGIMGNNNGIVRSNTVRQSQGSAPGVNAGITFVILDNTIKANSGWGISSTFGRTAYGGNNLLDNALGTVTGGTELRPNLCGGNTSCP